jgi:hypothetical protein
MIWLINEGIKMSTELCGVLSVEYSGLPYARLKKQKKTSEFITIDSGLIAALLLTIKSVKFA